jgi:hypothetical protein
LIDPIRLLDPEAEFVKAHVHQLVRREVERHGDDG